jgi:hypothetical protein
MPPFSLFSRQLRHFTLTLMIAIIFAITLADAIFGFHLRLFHFHYSRFQTPFSSLLPLPLPAIIISFIFAFALIRHASFHAY